MNKLHSIIISSLFVCAICVPGLLWIFSDTQDISEQEKRRLASFPKVSFDKSLLMEFPKQFDQYFNDHYGLRSKLIDLNQSWKSTLFNKSPTRIVIRGEQDWLFLDAKRSLSDHVGLIKLDDNVLPLWKQHLFNKQTWLNSLGIEYLLVPVPNKMNIYSENLPRRIRNHSGLTMLDKLVSTLKTEKTYDDFVELKPVLKEQKFSGPQQLQSKLSKDIKAEDLYFHQDTHWTSLGAFLSYQHIMQQLQRLLPTLEPAITFDQLDANKRDKKADIARMISIIDPEKYHRLEPKNRCAPKKPQTVSSFQETNAYKLRPKTLPTKTGCAKKSLRAVIVKDSFGAYIQPFFAESFQEVVFMHSYDLIGMESFLRDFKPDVYIDIRSERNIKYLLAPNQRLQDAVASLKPSPHKPITSKEKD